MALRRLILTEKRLSKAPETAQNYIEFMTKLFQDGHVVVLKPKINEKENLASMSPLRVYNR